MYFTEKFQEESIENMKDDVAKNETFSFISMKLKQAKGRVQKKKKKKCGIFHNLTGGGGKIG